MSKLVVLKLNGECSKGLLINLQIRGKEGEYSSEIKGILPPATEVIAKYQEWRSSYSRLEQSLRLKDKLGDSSGLTQNQKIERPEINIGDYLQRQREDCCDRAKKLKTQLNQWLNYLGFKRIEKKLREQLHPNEEIRFLIHTCCPELKKLPWHLWNFLAAYPLCEIVFAGLENRRGIKSKTPANQVRILAILGNDSEINLFRYKQELIQNSPEIKITFLDLKKRQEVYNQLRNLPWDIVYFADRSKKTESQTGQIHTGQIHIDRTETIAKEEIKSALKKAIENGLQLAIFNSCEGVGLTSEKEKLYLPQAIVMREPIPEEVGQKFLNYFLGALASGEPLHLAVRSAKAKLLNWESHYPCASWQPLIFQNPALRPLTWFDLLRETVLMPSYSRSEGKVGRNVLGSNVPRGSRRDPLHASPKAKSHVAPSPKKKNRPYPTQPSVDRVIYRHSSIFETSGSDSQNPIEKPKHKTDSIPPNLITIATSASIALSLVGFMHFFKPQPQIPPQPTMPRNSLKIKSKPQYHSTFKEVTGVPSGTFTYGGSTAWAIVRREIDPIIQSLHPEFRLIYVDHHTEPPSSGVGVTMLIDDHLNISQASRALKSTEHEIAEQRRFSMKQIPVAIDGIVFAVNQSLNIPGLTLSQLEGIYTGEITNWQEVGGPDLEIVPYSKSAHTSGSAHFLADRLLNSREFGSTVTIVTNTTLTLREVAATKGAIFYASAVEIIPQCTVKVIPIGRTSRELISPYQQPIIPAQECPQRRNQPNRQAFQDASYPLVRNLYVIVKQNGLIDQQAGEAYAKLLLSEEGQRLVERVGFVPID